MERLKAKRSKVKIYNTKQQKIKRRIKKKKNLKIKYLDKGTQLTLNNYKFIYKRTRQRTSKCNLAEKLKQKKLKKTQ